MLVYVKKKNDHLFLHKDFTQGKILSANCIVVLLNSHIYYPRYTSRLSQGIPFWGRKIGHELKSVANLLFA